MEIWLTENQTSGYSVRWKVKDIIFSKKTRYQELAILDLEEFGRTLVLDGAIQVTEKDEHIYNEMLCHVPLSTHPNPERVLIIGGGDGGVLRETLKYDKVKRVDMVEIDEEVIYASGTYLPSIGCCFNDPRANIIIQDGIEFVNKTGDIYDVILVDSSDPVGPAVQLFEYDFYKSCYDILGEDGILTAQTQSPFFYQDVLRRCYNNMKKLFCNTNLYIACVPTYPSGLWSFTMGSKEYDPHFTEVDDKINFNTKYFCADIYKTCFGLPRFIKDIIEAE
jgi:spermidine synthase